VWQTSKWLDLVVVSSLLKLVTSSHSLLGATAGRWDGISLRF